MTLLRVQMTNGQIAAEPVPKGRVLGGRAAIDFIPSQRGAPAAHPLAEESLFIVAPGIFAGTGAPQSGRLSVGGKSPLTGGIKEANAGETASHKLGRLGIRAILVEGAAKEWQILKSGKDGALCTPRARRGRTTRPGRFWRIRSLRWARWIDRESSRS